MAKRSRLRNLGCRQSHWIGVWQPKSPQSNSGKSVNGVVAQNAAELPDNLWRPLGCPLAEVNISKIDRPSISQKPFWLAQLPSTLFENSTSHLIVVPHDTISPCLDRNNRAEIFIDQINAVHHSHGDPLSNYLSVTLDRSGCKHFKTQVTYASPKRLTDLQARHSRDLPVELPLATPAVRIFGGHFSRSLWSAPACRPLELDPHTNTSSLERSSPVPRLPGPILPTCRRVGRGSSA